MNEAAQHVCPVCNGEKKLVGIFPVYAPGTPPERKKPYVELDCHFCNGSGYVDDKALERRAAGNFMRSERLSKGLGLREAAEQLGISPSELSKIEQGHD